MEPVEIFMGICIDLLKKKIIKTKHHAKINIFLIDSEQIKYLEHFKINNNPLLKEIKQMIPLHKSE
jgi:hypothetical protein